MLINMFINCLLICYLHLIRKNRVLNRNEVYFSSILMQHKAFGVKKAQTHPQLSILNYLFLNTK